ncbi:hypothetical protein Ocin01_01428 [Orchesella cincta]|uniref:Uncharacterized protein n=1 Tax=Orchesella cincta TaxID=48709 RepID=A0A1D2NIY8_ORCCI|nr:hypothetical protein Ocin01_01428 [Orchesella cincta]
MTYDNDLFFNAATGVTEPLLMDLVPYHLKNQRTVLKEIERCSSFINIEVLILYVWQEALPVMALIKDSDDFISLLEVPKTEEDLISTLSPGRFLSLAQIGVERMINIAQQLDVFSLLRLFGAKQTYYYILKWDYDSKWELETLLDIPVVHRWEQLLNIEEIYMVPRHEDQRVSLECRLKQIEADHILVTDDSDMSLKIEFVFDSEKLFPNMLNNINKVISLKFLRVIYGKTIWDKFTTFINTDNVIQEIEVDEGF